MLTAMTNNSLSNDYSQSANWLAWPERADFPVDVFYLYPTAWEVKSGQELICDITYKPMRNKARFLLAYQGTAFSAGSNLYAPYYRQFDARYLAKYDFKERMELMESIPWSDVKVAFEWYLANTPPNKPFVVVGHSQGAMLVKTILYKILKTRPELIKRLVAAYIIGFSVSEEDIEANPEFPFAQAADDFGVIISYNTEAPGVTVANPLVMPNSLVINPISWSRGEELALADDSVGSYIIDRYGQLQDANKMADARLDLKRGVVVCSSFDQAAFYGQGFEHLNPFPSGVLHIYDVALYYYDLRANIKQRMDAFLRSNDI